MQGREEGPSRHLGADRLASTQWLLRATVKAGDEWTTRYSSSLTTISRAHWPVGGSSQCHVGPDQTGLELHQETSLEAGFFSMFPQSFHKFKSLEDFLNY